MKNISLTEFNYVINEVERAIKHNNVIMFNGKRLYIVQLSYLQYVDYCKMKYADFTKMFTINQPFFYINR